MQVADHASGLGSQIVPDGYQPQRPCAPFDHDHRAAGPLQRVDVAGVFGDFGLFGGDHVHDHAALEHLGHAALDRSVPVVVSDSGAVVTAGVGVVYTTWLLV